MLRSSLRFLSFLCFYSRGVFNEYAFRTSVSMRTANCLMVSFGNLRISLHKTLCCCLFLSESNIFENSCVNLFQFDFISRGNTEKPFLGLRRLKLFVSTLCVDVSSFDVVAY